MLSGEASEFLDRAVMRLPLKDELHSVKRKRTTRPR